MKKCKQKKTETQTSETVLNSNKADKGRNRMSKTAKISLAIIGVGFIAGTTVVIGMEKIMKKIFINEDWPEEEWSNDNWTDEDL